MEVSHVEGTNVKEGIDEAARFPKNNMARYFVPYTEDHPATIEIKGHRLLLVGLERSDVVQELAAVGGDTVHELVLQTAEEQQMALAELAHSIGGGVVLTPAGMSLSAMMKNLEKELPWVH